MRDARFGDDGVSPLREITQASLSDLEINGLNEVGRETGVGVLSEEQLETII